jgi:hypothetical protein
MTSSTCSCKAMTGWASRICRSGCRRFPSAFLVSRLGRTSCRLSSSSCWPRSIRMRLPGLLRPAHCVGRGDRFLVRGAHHSFQQRCPGGSLSDRLCHWRRLSFPSRQQHRQPFQSGGRQPFRGGRGHDLKEFSRSFRSAAPRSRRAAAQPAMGARLSRSMAGGGAPHPPVHQPGNLQFVVAVRFTPREDRVRNHRRIGRAVLLLG